MQWAQFEAADEHNRVVLNFLISQLILDRRKGPRRPVGLFCCHRQFRRNGSDLAVGVEPHPMVRQACPVRRTLRAAESDTSFGPDTCGEQS